MIMQCSLWIEVLLPKKDGYGMSSRDRDSGLRREAINRVIFYRTSADAYRQGVGTNKPDEESAWNSCPSGRRDKNQKECLYRPGGDE